MSNIQHFFFAFGLLAFAVFLIGLFFGIVWLIVDHYDSKDRIKYLENKYCDLHNNLRGVEMTINRLETKTDNIIKETTVNDN